MNSTEPRRLIKFGNSSFVISLPLSWIKENNLSKGDLVYLAKNSENELIIQPSQSGNNAIEERTFIINVDKKDLDTIRREINSVYINGYDTVLLRGKTINQKAKRIKEFLGLLTGLSIIGKGEDGLLIKDVLSYEKLPPDEIISRINTVLLSMFKHLKEGIGARNFKKAYNETNFLDIEINRNYILIWKLLKKGTLNKDKNQLDLYNLWWLAMNQEYIGDEIKRIARTLTKINFNDIEYGKLVKMIEVTEKSYKDSLLAFRKRDRELALELAKKAPIKKCQTILGRDSNILLENLCDRFKTISRHIHYIIKVAIY